MCFVIPSEDAPFEAVGGRGRFQPAIAHIEYLIPLIDRDGGKWLSLGLVADSAHILSLADSIRFTGGY